MRSLNKSWIGIALAILFGVSLFFFRGSSRYSNLFNSDNFVANVSGTQISTSHFLRSLEMNIGQFAQMIGSELNGDQIRAFQIHQLVLQNLINNAIFENEFDKINFILDDSIIARKTKQRFPNLYLNNKINDDALNSFLRQQRLKIEDLVNIINYETRADVFDSLFFEKNYPTMLANKINKFNNQIRNIEILKVPFEKINLSGINKNSLTKNNLEIKNYYEENSFDYMSKEKRDISYFIIDKEQYKNNFIPSQIEVSNYFKNNIELYNIPEKRSFKQFNFKTIDEANEFKTSISGFTIDEIDTYADNNNFKYNYFADVDSSQVLDELSNVIFTLNINEVSDIVSTTLAHHIIVLEDIKIKRIASIDEVADTIENLLMSVELDNFFKDLKLKINQQILDGLSISEISEQNNLLLKQMNDIEQNSSEQDNLKISIINAAFSENKDFISNIFDFSDNKSFVVNVNEIYQSKVQDIDIVIDEVIADFIKSNKIEFANEIFEINNSDNDLQKINSNFGLDIEEIEIKLTSDALPDTLITKIFNSDLNSIVFSSDDFNAYFAKVKNIKIPNESNFSESISLLSELKNAFGNEIIKTKNISINNELINGLLSQYK